MMTNTITPYTGSQATVLTDALLASGSGIVIQDAQLVSAPGSANLYSGGLQGIGAGILLTSGATPCDVNDSTGFGLDNGLAGSAALDAVVNTVFQTQSYNATSLTLNFTVSDPAATSVSFDLVFGSEEYPEWVDAFVDVAVVMVNGVNVALFNHSASNPLSVISANLAAGYFVDNANGALPTEYDGVSALLKFVAPIQPGSNTITIAIGDTGDAILDSGIFVANLAAGTTPGSGVVSAPTAGSNGDDSLTGSAKAEYFDLQAGDDTVYAGAGDDIIVAGAGNDAIYGGSGADEIKGDAGDDLIDGGADLDTAVYAGAAADYEIAYQGANGAYTISAKANGHAAGDGKDSLSGVEFARFGDGSTVALGSDGSLSQVGGSGLPATPANHSGSIVLSGVAGLGQTLSAKVADLDGLPANAISYVWQADGVTLAGDGNSLKISAAEVGKSITVSASYTDLLGNAEFLVSNAKPIAAPGNGDFAISLLNLKAPLGASVMNPLTTLVQNAIELGVSGNQASLIVKHILGLSATLDLLHYDAWGILQATPGDAAALAVEKKMVQVAVLTSLGSDESGMELTQAILLANSDNTPLNLADKTVIANLLGLAPGDALVSEIWDRNDNIGSATASGSLTAVDKINAVWLDLQSGLSVSLSDSIATLSEHINQAPIGFATAVLAGGAEGSAYQLLASDLLAGFSDPEGGALSVANLSADHGVVTLNGDAYVVTAEAGYSGPVELSYEVLDPQGLAAPATQLFVLAPTPTPVNQAPVLTGPAAVLTGGEEDAVYLVSASSLLAGFSDSEGDTLTVLGLSADQGSVIDHGDGSFSIVPKADYNGPVTLDYSVSDGVNSVAASLSVALAAVNDAPVGTATAPLAAGSEDAAYVLPLASLLAGFSDVDSATLSVTGLSANHGAISANGDGTVTLTPEANYYGPLTLSYSVSDGLAAVAASLEVQLAARNDAPVASADTASAVAQLPLLIDVLANDSDVDNAGLAAANVGLTIKAGSASVDAGQGTVQVTGNQLSFTAAAGFTGVATLHYIATDGQADSALSSVSVTVSAPAPPVPAPPATVLGTKGNDKLVGTAGNDWIDGGKGADSMSGGAGDDTYIVDSRGDRVRELTGQGVDTVRSSVDYELADNTENLLLTGTGNLHGHGNAGANVIIGNAGNNQLAGGAGNDILVGGAGKDQMTGGSGADTFRLMALGDSQVGSKHDVIGDFKLGTDQIDLRAIDAVAASAAVDAFVLIGGTFTGVAGQLTFNAKTGLLSGDVNGDAKADFQIELVGVSAFSAEALVH